MVLLCVVAEYCLQGALQSSPVTSLEGGSGGPRTPREGAKKPSSASRRARVRGDGFLVFLSPPPHAHTPRGRFQADPRQ